MGKQFLGTLGEVASTGSTGTLPKHSPKNAKNMSLENWEVLMNLSKEFDSNLGFEVSTTLEVWMDNISKDMTYIQWF